MFGLSEFPLSAFSGAHFVPVNSQAPFCPARNLLIAYLFCWHTPRRNRENRNHFPLSTFPRFQKQK
jgi:hypothetical protein